jgi:hypothetical protein
MKRISSIFTVVVALLLLGSISVNAAPLMLGDSDQGEVIILARGGHGGHGPDDGTGYGPGDGTCDDGTGSDHSTGKGEYGQSEDQDRRGNAYGPGDGTGNDGVGPDDGTGYGPGDGTCDDGTGDLA